MTKNKATFYAEKTIVTLIDSYMNNYLTQIKKFVNKYTGTIFVAILFIGLYLYHKDISFIVLLVYGLFIKFILSESVMGILRKVLTITIWSAFIVTTGLFIYANNYFPHGENYSTGYVVCQNDDRGPCGEVYKEDLRGLSLPGWAKFFKESGGEVLWFGLFLAGVLISYKEKEVKPYKPYAEKTSIT